ncbi:hypothetical protein WICPIJ_009986 [Wickerhamomyces pijperi]|uniref:Folic acid synthesis protein fol1 n=1 Tax=Wickerhamomyces pijperi TaxID=599730 RepID=A0A9P8PK92_WICPI|nr:hypothetical protein WICPIJ_009986 [Wickerhamomyces pijperi]
MSSTLPTPPTTASTNDTKALDKVLITKLHSQAITGTDYWSRPTLQPIEITIELSTNFAESSQTDDLIHSLNYAVISRNVLTYLDSKKAFNFKTLEGVTEGICDVVLDEKKGGGDVAKVLVHAEKTEIRCDSIEIELNREKINGVVGLKQGKQNLDVVRINALKLQTLIGVFTFERLKKQYVSFDFDVQFNKSFNYYAMIEDVSNYVEKSNFKTVEALIESVCQVIIQNHQIISVKGRVTKPNAITFANGVGVEIIRTRVDFLNSPKIAITESSSGNEDIIDAFNLPTNTLNTEVKESGNIAYIAFGSNVGNQVANITEAINLINSSTHSKVLQTSSLYESEPMYHLDQPKFLNGVFQLSTSLNPEQLLKYLKEIEYDHMQRIKLIENGPRSIDLDILLYNELVMNTPELTIPHIRMIERTFVMQPLCELISEDKVHPVTAEPYHEHLKQLYDGEKSQDVSVQKDNLLKCCVPLINNYSSTTTTATTTMSLTFDPSSKSTERTKIMGILNTTPDSFSDGGKNTSLEVALANALEMVNNGAEILDIGGVSTRPGSKDPGFEEEYQRVVPLVRAIRASDNLKLRDVVISIDTYRSEVAKAALQAGADIINDISMGLYDDKMFQVIAESGAPYILNHTRGTPETMSSLNHYVENENHDLVEQYQHDTDLNHSDKVLLTAIARELSIQVQKAIAQGVKRWQLIIDPGIGFAKNLRQNLTLIKGTPLIKSYSLKNQAMDQYTSLVGLPILLGPSRKRFIGELTHEKEASERVGSTGAVVMACVGFGSDIVRVHDVKEVNKVVKVADALYRDLI